MAEKTLNTIIVLRNDKSTDWATSDVVLKEGEIGVSYLDNGNVVVKAGDGVNKWPLLKQVEGVFEQPVTLTQNFGYYNDVPAGSYKTYNDTVGMTTSEFLLSALKKTVNPTVTKPDVSMTASVESTDTGNYEIGSYITKVKWDGTNSKGSYAIGSATQSSGLADDDFSWIVTNKVTSDTATTVDGSFTLTDTNRKQITSTDSVGYVTIDATVTFDPTDAKVPKNNLQEDVPSLTITTLANGSLTKTLSATANATGIHRSFYEVKAAGTLKNPEDYSSADVRSLANKINSTKGLPNSLSVPAGSQQVILFARSGAYSTLIATDDKAMNAEVSFTKVAKAVAVKGANDYVPAGADGFDYDLWYVDWGAGIGAAKQLTLKWS